MPLYQILGEDGTAFHPQNGWVDEEHGHWFDTYPSPPLPRGTIGIVEQKTYVLIDPPLRGRGFKLSKKSD